MICRCMILIIMPPTYRLDNVSRLGLDLSLSSHVTPTLSVVAYTIKADADKTYFHSR